MVRPQPYAEYMEPSGRRLDPRRRSWLRTAQLNLVGWSALLGSCVLVAAAGIAVAVLTHLPLPLGAACGVAPLLVVVLLDRGRWARMQTGFSWGGSVEEVARVAAELEARGVHARVLTEDIANGWGQRAYLPTSGPVVKTAALEYVNRDADAVAEVLRRHGLPPPGVF